MGGSSELHTACDVTAVQCRSLEECSHDNRFCNRRDRVLIDLSNVPLEISAEHRQHEVDRKPRSGYIAHPH